MQSVQFRGSQSGAWDAHTPMPDADWVVVFGEGDFFHSSACYNELRAMFPRAEITGCSSAGSVLGTEITDGDVVVTAIRFNQSHVRVAVADLEESGDVRTLAEHLGKQLIADDLTHFFVFSDGLLVNGSEVAAGLNALGYPVTGGLAGDGVRFGTTQVMANAQAVSGRIAVIGIYGKAIVKSGCFAGWQEFGAQRIVTKSSNNVVYEIDNQPALALYKKYLGEYAKDLPGSGLRFPLGIQRAKESEQIIRTLLAINEEDQSLTFAGDVPQGCLCRLMKSNLDILIENAGMAAEKAQNGEAPLCMIVSCVGRRLVLGQLVEDELEIVRSVLGDQAVITGFYSYGELAPFMDVLKCELHNQTMTLTTISER